MKAAPFQYTCPKDVDDAVALLGNGRSARVLAGGQSLVPLLALRTTRADMLVDINRIDELARIERDGDAVVIGSMVRQRVAERSSLVADELPMLAHAISYLAHFQIRNRGTVGGSVAYADPAAEIPAVLMAHGGSALVRSVRGDRVIEAEDLFVGPFESSLASDELLLSVRFPRLPAGAGWSFDEVTRVHGNYALASAALWVTFDADGIDDARIAIGGATARTVRARAAEDALRGAEAGPDAIAASVTALTEELEPIADVHSSSEYRRKVAGVLLRRGLERAIERAKENQP